MPEITITMYEGRLESQKQEIVEVFTRELSRIIDREPAYISISFNEIPWDENVPENLRKQRNQKGGEGLEIDGHNADEPGVSPRGDGQQFK